MDAWHRKVAGELIAETPAGSMPEAAAALEVAFAEARSAALYVLELARAYRIKVAGTVSGDDVWIELGEGRVRFTLNRREGHVLVNRPDSAEMRVPSATTNVAQLGAIAREAIDGLVARWRGLPEHAKRLSAPPAEFEDEPTKG